MINAPTEDFENELLANLPQAKMLQDATNDIEASKGKGIVGAGSA